MKMAVKLTIAFAVVVLTLGAQQLVAATTYAVGTCTKFKSFVHIQDALNATPPPTTVLVCPTPTPYAEQITISQPVKLEGISNGNAAQAVIAPPSGGLTQTANTSLGSPVHFQIWVNNVSGPVNISNLTVDGTGNGVAPNGDLVAGIFFQNSPGSVSRVVTSNQAGNLNGIGILLEGGSAVPTVAANNNSVHGFDNTGIDSEAPGTSQLNATISGNSVHAENGQFGIVAAQGATTNISGNLVNVTANAVGIASGGSGEGSVLGNTVVGNGGGSIGYVIFGDAIPYTLNKSFHTGQGFLLFSAVATVQGNSITNSTVGIEFQCNANPNVIHNTISDAPTGINDVPSGLSVLNTYFNVPTIRNQGSCP